MKKIQNKMHNYIVWRTNVWKHFANKCFQPWGCDLMWGRLEFKPKDWDSKMKTRSVVDSLSRQCSVISQRSSVTEPQPNIFNMDRTKKKRRKNTATMCFFGLYYLHLLFPPSVQVWAFEVRKKEIPMSTLIFVFCQSDKLKSCLVFSKLPIRLSQDVCVWFTFPWRLTPSVDDDGIVFGSGVLGHFCSTVKIP